MNKRIKALGIILIFSLLFFMFRSMAYVSPPSCHYPKNSPLFVLVSSWNIACPTERKMIFSKHKKYVSCAGIQSWTFSGVGFSAAFIVKTSKGSEISHLFPDDKKYPIKKATNVTVPLGNNNKVKVIMRSYGQMTAIYIKIKCWLHD